MILICFIFLPFPKNVLRSNSDCKNKSFLLPAKKYKPSFWDFFNLPENRGLLQQKSIVPALLFLFYNQLDQLFGLKKIFFKKRTQIKQFIVSPKRFQFLLKFTPL